MIVFFILSKRSHVSHPLSFLTPHIPTHLRLLPEALLGLRHHGVVKAGDETGRKVEGVVGVGNEGRGGSKGVRWRREFGESRGFEVGEGSCGGLMSSVHRRK